MTMPYYDLVEPITAYFSEDEGMGRLDYWGGIDRYLYNASGTTYQIVPTTLADDDGSSSQETCFVSGHGNAPVSVFPDLTFFPTAPDTGDCEIDGVACTSFTLNQPTYNETTGFDGVYTLYVDATLGTPMRFHVRGFNVILGSHYDEYIFDYLKVVPSLEGIADHSTWNPPAQMDCQALETDDDSSGADDDGGPTRGLGRSQRPQTDAEGPLSELRGLFPGGQRERSGRFAAWAVKHSKSFEHEHEMYHRAQQFHATEMYVNAMNRRRLSFWLEANHMADWTKEERDHLRGRLHTPVGEMLPEPTFAHEMGAAAELPTDVDWRVQGAVLPPKDQGTCGSCWSYGATGTTEGQVFLKTGVLAPLSQQVLMDCSWGEGNDACDGGLDFRGYEWMLKHDGEMASEKSYPYMNSDGYCRAESSTVGATIAGYTALNGTVAELKDAIANVGPISVSVDASPDSFYFYSGGLYYDADCKSGVDDLLDHTVLAVGYEGTEGGVYTIVKNSWSQAWGDGGYIYVSQEDNCCGVATQPTYVTLAE